MTVFMLVCFMNGVMESSIYFKSVNDCTFYAKNLSNQEFSSKNINKKYDCLCKLVPKVDPQKDKIY